MFDDKEPQDIFAGTDKTPIEPQQSAVERASVAPQPRPQAMAPQAMSAPAMAPQRSALEGSSRSHLLRNMLIIILALAAIGGGAYLAYAFMIRPIMNAGVATVLPESTLQTTAPADTDIPAATGSPDDSASIPTTPDALNPTFLDSDGDGLTNAEELEAGTSSTNPDTDGDGLGDREEVKVYGTDPRRTDTDGDGYLDGAEVQGGYNPNGPGMLLQIPTTP